ncbi:MAG: XisH family protein [Caldilineaceae bacterium]
MPARDLVHEAIKNALIKDGWIITDDPLILRFGDEPIYVDLGAEKVIGAEKANQKIAVEVKSFLSPSFAADFHLAIGQYINYQIALREAQPARVLYLAVPRRTYSQHFARKLVQLVIEQQHIKFIVFDDKQELITVWHN